MATPAVMDRARLEALKRRVAQDKKLDPSLSYLPSFKESDSKRFEFEGEVPIYKSPSDFINEFGRVLTLSSPLDTTSSDIGSHERLKKYMQRRFPERLAQCRALAAISNELQTAWRSRTRKREAEWGDPEDLGVISAPLNSVHFTSSYAQASASSHNNQNSEASEFYQKCSEAKFLLPSFFVPIITTVGLSLYYSNRPSIVPVHPLSLFNANSAVWSSSERKTFIELYLQYPKNFGRIAANLPNKSCEQCVEFYYRHKKEYRLKQMVASYRKAMVAQRKMIPTQAVTSTTIPQVNSIENLIVDDDSSSAGVNTATNSNNSINNNAYMNSNANNRRKTTGRPVGRPKNKDK